MKVQKLIILLVIVLFILSAAGINAGFIFYKEYKKQLSGLGDQSQLLERKVASLEQNLDSFRVSLRDLNSSFKNYSEDLLVIKEKVNLGDSGTKDILMQIENVKRDLQDWQEKYSMIIDGLRGAAAESSIEPGNKDANAIAVTKEVELGEVSVEKKGVQ